MRVRLFKSADGDGLHAIDQSTTQLALALSNRGHEVSVERWMTGRVATLVRVDLVVVPYNPFMWGRWGFAPRLIIDVARIRLLRQGPTVALIIHEPYVPITSPKSLLMGVWQRAQLLVLLLLADHRFASIERWASRFNRIRPTSHLPSGSNLPDARPERDRTRDDLDVRDALVVATLSTGHPSHLRAYVEAALERLVEHVSREVVFLLLGAGALAPQTHHSVRTVTPGALESAQLGAHLAAADLLLVPLVDGVSTRRSSLMAGLCEEVCIVGTSGFLTDPSLLSTELELVEVGDPLAFATRAVELALDGKRRRDAAERGRALFEARFAWDVIAAMFEEAVG
jgi:glycosyltransferase involved in cell wall biosynthesis